MEFFVQNVSSILFFPLWVAVVIFIGKITSLLKSYKTIFGITLLATIWGLISSILVFAKTITNMGYVFEDTFSFISINNLNFELGCYVDLVSAFMLLVIFAVTLFVQIYSYFYMKNDESFPRFFALMNLFTFSMCGLVLAPTLFQTYVFWELVGVTSYLLIGFWYKKISAANAAKKAFIMNRIGDFCLLAGIILSSVLIYNYSGSADLIDIPYSGIDRVAAYLFTYTSEPVFIANCILLLFGSIAKSAQFPLHTWLADAMEGPTPVSALIHSATMVAAGVFLINRLYPIYYQSHFVMNFILVIGLITAIICAFFAITCRDIKRILAYSTSSQLGIMFIALGTGALTGSMIYLASHAFIKSMLFLIAGIVMIAYSGSTSIDDFGGLRKKMPILAGCYLIGAFALAGVLFSGFSAKALIFHHLFETHSYITISFLILISFMTAFYIFRLYFVVFEGKSEKNITNLPKLILVPVSCLALIVLVIGLFFPNMGKFNNDILPLVFEVIAVALAFVLYIKVTNLKKLPLLYNLSFNRLYIDNLYDFLARKLYSKLALLANFIDDYLYDGMVGLVVFITRLKSYINSKMQTGVIQSYFAYSFLILALILTGFCLIYSLIAYWVEV